MIFKKVKRMAASFIAAAIASTTRRKLKVAGAISDTAKKT
jgi:hypothetical protein